MLVELISFAINNHLSIGIELISSTKIIPGNFSFNLTISLFNNSDDKSVIILGIFPIFLFFNCISPFEISILLLSPIHNELSLKNKCLIFFQHFQGHIEHFLSELYVNPAIRYYC